MIEQTMSSEQYRRMIGLDDATGDDQKTARNALRGHKAQVVGESFQTRLNAYHALLMKEDYFLYILETKPPMKAISQGRGKPPHYILLGSGPCDYVFAFADGLAGTFDAKSTGEKKTMYWPAVRRHQLVTLKEAHFISEGKAPAFALVEWRAHDEVRLHPIETIDGHIVRRHDGIVVPNASPNPMSLDEGPGWDLVVHERWGRRV